MTTLLDLSPSEAAAQVTAGADEAWARSFVAELDRRLRGRPLEQLVDLWGLSGAAAARLFCVSRQAFAKWLASGPPADRSATVADLAAATEILARYVKRERIAAVVRRTAPALGGASLLEMATEGRSREVLEHVRVMFDLRRVQP